MNAAIAVAGNGLIPLAKPANRNFAQLGLRAGVYCILFSVIFVPEFPRSGTPNILYAKAGFGFRVVDVGILAVALAHVACISCLRSKRVSFPRSLLIPGVAFLACITAAAVYGASRGGNNLFFDWRGLALGIALYLVWSFWLQSSEDVAFALRCLSAYVALRLLLLYVFYAAGYRDTLLGASIPIFDGPILSAIVFTTLLALNVQQYVDGIVRRASWVVLAIGGCAMVLLCMRRTYWAELGIGIVLVILMCQRHRVRWLAICAAAVCVAGLASGPSILGRLKSLDVTRSDTPYSADNADHLNDLYDAWYQVQRSPVFGIGLGTSYETWHIRKWKSESVMVHNAPLHVWLKYGVAGLICYLWFHIALLRWLYCQSRTGDKAHSAFLTAAFSYLCAQFIVTLGFAPWPYSELQLTVLMSFLLASIVALSQSHRFA